MLMRSVKSEEVLVHLFIDSLCHLVIPQICGSMKVWNQCRLYWEAILLVHRSHTQTYIQIGYAVKDTALDCAVLFCTKAAHWAYYHALLCCCWTKHCSRALLTVIWWFPAEVFASRFTCTVVCSGHRCSSRPWRPWLHNSDWPVSASQTGRWLLFEGCSCWHSKGTSVMSLSPVLLW